MVLSMNEVQFPGAEIYRLCDGKLRSVYLMKYARLVVELDVHIFFRYPQVS
jgi:hypothetical protein